MRQLVAWGARANNGALVSAAEAGQLEAMQLLRAWGGWKGQEAQDRYGQTLEWTARGGQLEAMKLLEAWRREETKAPRKEGGEGGEGGERRSDSGSDNNNAHWGEGGERRSDNNNADWGEGRSGSESDGNNVHIGSQ